MTYQYPHLPQQDPGYLQYSQSILDDHWVMGPVVGTGHRHICNRDTPRGGLLDYWTMLSILLPSTTIDTAKE